MDTEGVVYTCLVLSGVYFLPSSKLDDTIMLRYVTLLVNIKSLVNRGTELESWSTVKSTCFDFYQGFRDGEILGAVSSQGWHESISMKILE